MKFAVVFLVVVLATVDAQLQLIGGSTFGSRGDRPFVITPNINRKYTSSFSGNNLGQYKADNAGAYNINDGQYHPDNSGAYVHEDNKYRHQEDKYKHTADKFGGFGGGDRSGAGAGLNSGLTKGLSGQKSFVVSGFGEPVSLQQGSAQGKYDNKNYGIIRQTGRVEEDGYQYLYETENGILAEEQGKLANRATDNEAMHATGFYTYTGPDAIVYRVDYVADEGGFQPDAAHLPTPPPVPEYILRALDYQRSIGTLVD